MRSSHSLNAATFKRLSWSVRALTAGISAIAVGFLLGVAAVAPLLSDNSPDNAAAIQTRFERRSLDPQGNYPDPFAYRTPSPDFGTQSGPSLGAYAKQRAQQLGDRSAPERLPRAAAEAFAAAPQPSVQQRAYDKHTGVSY